MDETTLFLRMKALAHSLDTLISANPSELTEDIMVLSEMLVQVVNQYDDLRDRFLL